MAWYEQIIAFIIPLSLYFCFTNYVYLSAIGALMVLLLPFAINRDRNYRLQNTARKMMIALATFFIIAIISILLMRPSMLLDFGFYRRDGNVFITFLSLFVLICSAVNFDIWTIIKRFVYITTIANMIGIGMHFLLRQYPEYRMFFTAHNAAGGFLGMAVIFNFALIGHRKKGKGIPFICLLVNLFGLYLTDSRGSLFPLIGAFVYLFLNRKTFFKNADVIINVLVFLVMFIFCSLVAATRGNDILVHLDAYVMPKEFKGGFVDKILSGMNRGGTVIDRFYYLFPRALYMFNLSPIIGTGMGTFNDVEFNFVGAENFLCLNISPLPVNSDNHAHNSFFHILAENGIVGLLAIVLFIWYVRSYSRELEDRNLSNLLFLCINFAVLTSFFEHRLFTPAEMLPFVYILGMIISKENYKKKEEKYAEEYCCC